MKKFIEKGKPEKVYRVITEMPNDFLELENKQHQIAAQLRQEGCKTRIDFDVKSSEHIITVIFQKTGTAALKCGQTLLKDDSDAYRVIHTRVFNQNFEESQKPVISDEDEIEAKIKEKGLNAPRLNPKMIDSKIVNSTYSILESGKCMVCEITLENGFTVRGEAAVVSKSNFDEEIGKELSFKKAREKIWELEAYLLQEKLFQKAK